MSCSLCIMRRLHRDAGSRRRLIERCLASSSPGEHDLTRCTDDPLALGPQSLLQCGQADSVISLCTELLPINSSNSEEKILVLLPLASRPLGSILAALLFQVFLCQQNLKRINYSDHRELYVPPIYPCNFISNFIWYYKGEAQLS
ncbi:uncharacterized protein PV09_09713 [Verruconis gallopava]|uniref:Uncharacterized protein n=1 Tax=Verruconis gallopava TaxID=253628 RepID=A0A0D1ZVJ1_9PEZI|nr:uncharacterized protein PV09_09713 [Verruconis gallopava]KIV98477.1 hypothetical protein PV09_09713 [Verruconis gallopava]